jgi:AcrR family transcriptional regulator
MSDEITTTTRSGSRRERKKLDKLERIQHAAWTLFRRDGYQDTTTRAVAEAAGVATGTVFLYAPDKPALLALAFEPILLDTMAQAERDSGRGSSPLDGLTALFSRLLAVFEENRQLAAELVRPGGGIGGNDVDRRTSVVGRALDLLAGTLQASQENEHAHYLDAGTLAHSCMALYLGTLALWVQGWLPSGEDPKVFLRRGLERLLQERPGTKTMPLLGGARTEVSRHAAVARPSTKRGAGIFRDRDDFVD